MSGHRSLKSLRKDGTEFEADVALAPITDGKAMFAFAGCRDITSKKSEEKELLEKTRQLEMVNQELEKYGYTISHDLKSPLQKIQALTDLMIAEIKEGRAENEIDTLSSFLKESVKSMETLISEVLDEAKAKAHREGKGKEEVSVPQLFAELEKLVVIPANFEIHIHCSFTLSVSRKYDLLQIFLNLFSNAIKYNDKEQGVIEVSCDNNGDHYLFRFKDNGPGIEKEKQKEIFGLFEKVGERSDSHGVGLFTVKNLLDKHGGTINVESEPGEGAEFVFTWPKR